MIGLIKKIVFHILSWVYRIITPMIKVDEDLVVFMAFHGRGVLDNPKALYQQLLKDYPHKKVIWILNKKDSSIDESYPYPSYHYFLTFMRAKYWVVNCKLPPYLYKKKNQVYLQTWHGTPLKRLAHDIVEVKDQSYYRDGSSRDQMVASYDQDVRRYDYMISPNSFCDDVFQSAFKVKEDQLLKCGYPRNDILSSVTKQKVEEIKLKYHLPLDKKIILYAPTMRDNQFDLKGYHIKIEADFNKWKEVLSNEYILLFKPHYLIVSNQEENESLKDFFYEIDSSKEISELYLISDVLITDYSSVFFDYASLNRPIYFYMYDKKEYEEVLRGFYLDVYQDLPGKVYENEDDLLKDIHEKKFDDEKLRIFNERFNHRQNGHCSKDVLEVLFKLEV